MYRRSDPRWNRTIQHITDNLEHANESAQENIYGFTQSYISPCFSSVSRCLSACTAPCFPAHHDRRRHRGRSRGRAELSFDFYDDWEQDEGDGLLGWGNDNLDRLLGGSASSYGTIAQPGRQRAMSYGQRNRDPRYNSARRKNTVHDVGPDPTIIPSSSYFGFLGRLPFNVGGKGLRYKPSAADLVDHPGAARPPVEELPLIEDGDEDAPDGSEHKGQRRQRSDTHTSAHTTDSFSSRGDIFPSEDELDDAVPLDDEFATALERRATGQWNDESSSNKDKTRSSSKSTSKRPSNSRVSTHTASSRNTQESGRRSHDDAHQTIDERDTGPLDGLRKEEDSLHIHQETAIQRSRHDAHPLAVKRGLLPDQPLQMPSKSRSASPKPPPPSQSQSQSQMSTLQSTVSPLLRSPVSESVPFPKFVDPQTMSDSSAMLLISESEFSSVAPTPKRPLSIGEGATGNGGDDEFVPARLPNFGE